ncbi:3',5'-cyclic adenosine monophosphate phosphodiesterase CpdA [Kordia antarctica]|uniref:3',5'-cyclic adenosine monophosphate phosphodiesterase CpdA n=1 Tax=Kordia antarctica TaxID=1218801 RepID=A0A7L4ZNF7_9FLAO|nr:metallophosphoesterase [Kordia antarctica]QHI38145.1 3',5'-cyclic adenosine monophosphate phosphodiesterase CpdA [Kordia antarctica]
MLRFLVPIILILILELYTFFSIRALTSNKFILIGYWIVTFVIYGIIFYQMNVAEREGRFSISLGYTIAMALTFLIPKLFILAILFVEDIFRFFTSLFNYFQHNGMTVSEAIPSRRKFLSQLALGIAAIPFAGFIYGVFQGRYNYKVIKHTMFFDDLPEAFDGYKLTQISDIHSGSFDNREKIEYAVDLINEQKSDLILFTGDIVNAVAEEMNPWIDTFKRLEATDGLFSILGNHDYGYYAYEDQKDIEENHKKIEKVHEAIGFDLLLNDKRTIEKNGQKLNILGVENWGASRHFPKKGSLREASKDVADGEFNILMSHDPSHFDYKEMEVRTKEREDPAVITDEPNIINFEKKIQLTLAGHTHGMQFGIEIPFLNLKWSPAKYRYPRWAGLYEEAGKYLYVNRGFGVLAFPGRVGIWPEITVIELKKRNKIA